jgi:hypothetical protein
MTYLCRAGHRIRSPNQTNADQCPQCRRNAARRDNRWPRLDPKNVAKAVKMVRTD